MNISAALLAGGESRRMGQDKATLVFHGKPLWQIQLDLLRKLRPREILLSARTDPGWRPADVHFVPDQTPSRGPLSGLAATLARADAAGGHAVTPPPAIRCRRRTGSFAFRFFCLRGFRGFSFSPSLSSSDSSTSRAA